jgi:rRNA-processing protein FCF1
VRHLLVSSRRDRLADGLRVLLPPSSVLLTARGVDATLERLARSARVDVVVTDDAAVRDAIREEVPGCVPVVLVAEDASASEALERVEEAFEAP